MYIAGGFDGERCLNTAEMYDPALDQWTVIPSMQSPRSGVAVISYQDAIYAVGGFDGERRLATGR